MTAETPGRRRSRREAGQPCKKPDEDPEEYRNDRDFKGEDQSPEKEPRFPSVPFGKDLPGFQLIPDFQGDLIIGDGVILVGIEVIPDHDDGLVPLPARGRRPGGGR